MKCYTRPLLTLLHGDQFESALDGNRTGHKWYLARLIFLPLGLYATDSYKTRREAIKASMEVSPLSVIQYQA